MPKQAGLRASKWQSGDNMVNVSYTFSMLSQLYGMRSVFFQIWKAEIKTYSNSISSSALLYISIWFCTSISFTSHPLIKFFFFNTFCAWQNKQIICPIDLCHQWWHFFIIRISFIKLFHTIKATTIKPFYPWKCILYISGKFINKRISIGCCFCLSADKLSYTPIHMDQFFIYLPICILFALSIIVITFVKVPLISSILCPRRLISSSTPLHPYYSKIWLPLQSHFIKPYKKLPSRTLFLQANFFSQKDLLSYRKCVSCHSQNKT